MNVQGKVVAVTGAASGIGRALVRRFAREGAKAVAALDRNGPGAEAVARELGGVCTAAAVDVARADEVAAAIDRIERDLGPIDLFCSNAGIVVEGGVETPDEVWERSWQVNVMAHVYAARVLVPRMIARGGGYLLQTASAAGLLSQIGSATYSVTKHGAVAFAEFLSITYGAQGIGVSVLCPQAVNTAMIQGFENGGVAGVDGVIEPEAVADAVVEGLADERFLILPHPTVIEYFRRKGSDYERWLRGMRRLQERYVKPA
jgi:NAD(P)-dependent dehydrogenase (short-subunit alcohol dehydrogenase family)